MRELIIKKQSAIRAARPFLKWVGGKGKLVPDLKAYLPSEYKDFYEPFVGGGALFFSLKPAIGHINDTNATLMKAYENIKNNVDRLVSELTVLQNTYWSLPDIESKKDLYLSKRTEFNQLLHDNFEKTVLLIFLNKTCFNGMYRENASGKFNVPFGQHAKPAICDKSNLLNVSEALQHTTITCGAYELAVSKAKQGDFIYFDPPYAPLNITSSFTSYQAEGFTANNQEKLRDVFAELAGRGCKIMLSNSNTPLIRELYKKFNIHEIQAARSINSVGSGRSKITELLITSY